MKKIWIVNYYTTPPAYADNLRHIEFAKKMQSVGFDVTIFTAGFLRGENINLLPDKHKFVDVAYDNLRYVHIRVKKYSGNGIDRMISIFQFAYRIFLYRKHFEKPDIILHNIHAPFDYPVMWSAKKYKAQYIVEAWDLWPDSFVRFGLISKNNPIVKLAYKIEKRLYEKADKIIFSFEGGVDYLSNRKWTKETGGKIDINKVYYINNGVNLHDFYRNTAVYQLDDLDLKDKEHFKIIYVGSIRLVNNIKQLVDAAALLKENPRYRFLIYGDGDEREYLENYCKENNIFNVFFKEKWVPFHTVPYIISQSSLNILNYQKEFGAYGISSGKFFQYLAAGKPICCNIKVNYCEIEKHNLGIAQDLDTPRKYADAILQLGSLNQNEYDAMCERVINISKEFDYEILSQKLVHVIEK